jgi:hypothetical protein
MKIEPKQFYRTREGFKAGTWPSAFQGKDWMHGVVFSETVISTSWQPNGTCKAGSHFDIVSEWVDNERLDDVGRLLRKVVSHWKNKVR